MNIAVGLLKEGFHSCSGLFAPVYSGLLTHIVQRFESIGSNDVLQLVIQRDENGRTPLDLASYLGFKNIVLYLMTNLGTPSDVIH